MLIVSISSVERLHLAFKKVRDNRGAPGGDGMTIRHFEKTLEARLARLSQELYNGAYWPSPLRIVDIPKKNGGLRRLNIPSIVDRVAQTSAASALTPILDPEFEESSFAYRTGRSVKQAVQRVDQFRREGYIWAVEGDIDNYFDNIPHNRLVKRLERYVDCEQTIDLITRWLDAYSETDCGVPQGSPISPLLSNLYLDDIDEAIESDGVRLVRFADDFLIVCKSENKAETALSKISRLLKREGLSLNPEKTQIVCFDEGLRFLGHLFVRSVVLKEVSVPEGDVNFNFSMPIENDKIGEPDEKEDKSDSALGPSGVSTQNYASGLRVLYIMEGGRRLGLYGNALSVEMDGQDLLRVPTHRIGRVEIGPNVSADDAALRHAARESIDVAFVDGHGTTTGILQSSNPHRHKLHLAQAHHVVDMGLRVDLARQFVRGRMINQRVLLRRLNRKRKDPAIAQAAHQLKRRVRLLGNAKTIAELMGMEGYCSKIYWGVFGRTLNHEAHGFKFLRRNRRPPRDPINVVMSYFASLLERDLTALLQRRGLHPGFGILHETQDVRSSLALDLMEEFRAPLIEGHAVYLFNNHIFKQDMFEQVEGKGCYLWAPGVKELIRSYEAKLDDLLISPHSGNKVKWRRLFEEQILMLINHLEGEGQYKPYCMKA